ncbi:MAG: peptidoglycan bridge formation glycyltransferase FemA/FemB family protein [Candidatus Saccharibacteria bacterium]
MILNTGRHLLQSEQWAEFQKTIGNQVLLRSGLGWQYLAIVERGDGRAGKYFKRLYTPYGPSYKDTQALKKALDDLENQAKKLGADYVRVEPLAIDKKQILSSLSGYKKTAHSFQPVITQLIDLNRPFEDVLKDTTKTNRYLWKKAPQNGIKFSQSYKSAELDKFLEMMNATSARTKAAFKPDSYYKALIDSFGSKKAAGVAYASVDNDILVGAIYIDDVEAKIRYYLFAGSFDKARKYSANSPLLMYLIEGAKKRGFKYFDLFGVSPIDDANHRWAGLSKFKRSFGGFEVRYNGTYEKPLKKAKYKAMSLARKLAK